MCIFQQETKQYLTLCHTWDSNLQYTDPDSMGRVTTPGGDQLDDLLTPCAGTPRMGRDDVIGFNYGCEGINTREIQSFSQGKLNCFKKMT